MVATGARFIRGNHDNPATCRAHKRCIPDGTIENNMMFIGGALSVDKAMRIEDFSWWKDEELPIDVLDRVVDEFSIARPEIMVTHECPERIAALIVASLPNVLGTTKMDPRFSSRTRRAFDAMFDNHMPALWLFGHWHVPFDRVIGGTRFVCLPELATVDVDTEKAELLHH